MSASSNAAQSKETRSERHAATVRGIVQGVGFRPFVHRLAGRLGLSGFVTNRSGEVYLEVEGPCDLLRQFHLTLELQPPPLARIDSVTWRQLHPEGKSGFLIRESSLAAALEIFISPDIATCADCLAELFDPRDRRYRYPFINCTNCGPRLTIIQGAPYDRERTTMAGFRMCSACRQEYENPDDRRYHAQPIACPRCGPRLGLVSSNGTAIPSDDPLAVTIHSLRSGRIMAVKGLGGFHLACDARSDSAVKELRRRKHRDEKPFAVMVETLDSATRLCEINPAEQALLRSAQRPIVLLKRRTDSAVPETLSPDIAPANPTLGLMLPYTPLHHLLLREFGGPLVMTSGNLSDEPIAYEDQDACERLGSIADLILTHDRPIRVRCDDSVTRVIDRLESPLRRSRGAAPGPVTLPISLDSPVLAVGGQLKGTFALGRGRQAFLSHHLGDLDHYSAYQAFERDIDLYERLFDIRPELIVHDLHPDYATTGYALRRGKREGCRLLAVQHHHAHVASCMAEHGLISPVIGIAFDGTGYGTDGTIWGGEFLLASYQGFHRAAHLRAVGLPGGDQAVREPWRMALSCLMDAGSDHIPFANHVPQVALSTVRRTIARKLNTPSTSSMGRLFDAVASLIGLRTHVTYEGQAAVELEWLASQQKPDGIYPFDLTETSSSADQAVLEIDTRPVIRAVIQEIRAGIGEKLIARRFHSTMIEVMACVCHKIRRTTGLDTVVLTGGVFMNALLASEATARLAGEGFQIYRHQTVPTNDGGLCLGQLAVAAGMISG